MTVRSEAARANGTPQLSHREQEAYYAALRDGVHLIDARMVTAKLAVSPEHAKQIVHKLFVKGAVERVARGQYAVVPPEVLFNRRHRGVDPRFFLHDLMQRAGLDCLYYVAYQSAAQFYDAVHQMPFVLQIVLARRHRPIRSGGMEVRFVYAHAERIFGIVESRYQGVPLRVSDRERTALDLVDRPALGGGIEEVTRTLRRLLEGADRERLAQYAVRLGNHSTAQRLGHILETIDSAASEKALGVLAQCRGRLVIPLEPGGSPGGEIDRRWRIRVNAELENSAW